MTTKVYTILKSSYEKNEDEFVENLFFANASSIDALKSWLQKIIMASDVKRVWLSDKENDKNLFYIEYSQNFETEFHHGFAVQVLNLSTHEQGFVTSKDPMFKTISSIASDIIKERNQRRQSQ